MTADPPPPLTQDDLPEFFGKAFGMALRKIRDLDAKVQNVCAVIDSFDNADVSPTLDQSEILDALRKVLRT